MDAPSCAGHSPAPRQWTVALAALGVVFGDIGTSPLYAFRECFSGSHAVPVNEANLTGAASLIVWALVVVVSIDYLGFILRLDNKGEGGILALGALVRSAKGRSPTAGTKLFGLGIFGAALVYADGILTPSMSVLSAVEGLAVVAEKMKHSIVPTTVVILIGLFSIQKFGTGKVGGAFGPIILVWFFILGALGIPQIMKHPEVLLSLSPHSAVMFLVHEWKHAFPLLGAVFLAVTGTEALYADLGHFGRRAIRLAWFAVVFPGLVLNYLGQAALLKANPAAAFNPFYNLVGPSWVMPLTILATMAAIIASQALISGAFSLTSQAIQLGCLPRMAVRYTSSTEKGQVYIPLVNWVLMVCCVLLVVVFQSSSKLAGAYGIGISLTMVVTTFLFRAAGRRIWGWSRLKANLIAGTFLTIDSCFFAANSLKLLHGGTLPLAIAAVLVFLMVTWRWGRARVIRRMEKQSMPVELLIAEAQRKPIHRVPGTAVFMSGKRAGVPVALLHNLKHNQILHEHVILMHVETLDVPVVSGEDRVQIEDLGGGFHFMTVRFGFSETPDVPAAMKLHMPAGLTYDHGRTTFFLGRESYAVAKDTRGFNRFRLAVFSWLSRNSTAATAYFRLPPSRVVELGAQLTV